MLTLDDQVYPYSPSWVWKGRTSLISKLVTLSFHFLTRHGLTLGCNRRYQLHPVSFLGPFSAEGLASRKVKTQAAYNGQWGLTKLSLLSALLRPSSLQAVTSAALNR